MTAKDIKLIDRRFHELAIKEALGDITIPELHKLERYQVLRRARHGLDVVEKTQPRFDYSYRMLKKEIGAHRWAIKSYRCKKP